MKRLILCAAVVFGAGVAQGDDFIIDSDMTIDSDVHLSVFGSASGSSSVNMYGGSLSYLLLYDYTRASVSGGNIGTALRHWNNSVTTIYGTDFNYPYGPIPDSEGTLTGTLRNGDPLDADFQISDDSSIILAIPEPSTLILLLIALTFATVCWWRRYRKRRLA